MTYEWTDLTYREKQTGNSALYIFPLAVFPGVPDPRRTIQQLVAAVCGAVNCPNGITFRDRRGLAIEWR